MYTNSILIKPKDDPMLLDYVKTRTLSATGLNEDQLTQLINADDRVLHDPFLYDGMDVLVDALYQFKQIQDDNQHELLVIDTDYDTDGIMSASVLSAALDVFNINHRVYIPSMSDGYGLNPKAVREMKYTYEKGGYHVHTILTADNGTNAVRGVDEANANGICVLVTDHHLGGEIYAEAAVIVNPNKRLPNGELEPYPFKGNAGATVAWKSMLAYATKYAPEKLSLIKDLVVFAGIANVADVMPILDENHYIVKKAVDEICRLVNIQNHYRKAGFSDDTRMYEHIKNTPYTHYNTVFHGLYDIIKILQQSKDDKRAESGKNPIPLKKDEELIGWYLSPLLNAPRRIHETCKEAMVALLSPNKNQRETHIKKMLEMNALKSVLRDEVLKELDMDALSENEANVLFVNVRHGISGLIAGQITGVTQKACIVFSLNTDTEQHIYDNHDFDHQHNKDQLIIGGSARSTHAQPLDVIVGRIKEIRPDIVVGGGGHGPAAGYSIYYKYLDVFTTLFKTVAAQVEAELAQLYMEQVENGDMVIQDQNVIRLGFTDDDDTASYAHVNIEDIKDTFAQDLKDVYTFQNTLKPFGKDFNGQTEFQLVINPKEIKNGPYNLNLSFWKTLKFNIHGVEVLTFDIELADKLKARMNAGDETPIIVTAALEMNEFRGKVTPQLQLKA